MVHAVDERVKKILVEYLCVDEAKIAPDAIIMDDLGADSLDMVELIMAAEEEFNCEIPDEEAEKAITVQDAIDLVRKHAKE